ncbi:MAG: hypothetical protein NVSMB57_04140 [Actinomycetota bacterium]
METLVQGKPWTAFIGERLVGVIATTGSDGMPHAVPVEVIVHEGRVYVWCHRTSAKCVNAERDARAAMVAYKGNDGVLVRGSVRVLGADDALYERITQRFLEKYSRSETFGNDALIEIRPARVTAFD